VLESAGRTKRVRLAASRRLKERRQGAS
jgi:hypothetical protein